jgi:hypothetical protein
VLSCIVGKQQQQLLLLLLLLGRPAAFACIAVQWVSCIPVQQNCSLTAGKLLPHGAALQARSMCMLKALSSCSGLSCSGTNS